MRIKKAWNRVSIICLIAVMVLSATMAVQGYSGESSEEAIVASGVDFVLTKKDVDAYSVLFTKQNLKISQENVIHAALKYELLSKEYRKINNVLSNGGDSEEDSSGVTAKIRDAAKYMPKILDDYRIPEIVIESYYRSNPEKYRIGEASDGTLAVKPLDDELKNEIRFNIIEIKKHDITKEFVDSLISKYHITILKDTKLN